MVKSVDTLTIAAQAKLEVNEELRKTAIGKLKDLYRSRAKAQTIVDNIDREIADTESAAEQGNLG